ncbi:MAG TPA: PAS domain S-box protein [Anaeromyxobacteraceae bacterium]|nr:PAS domain S-box protein [Anaeromyxobacteraceae bacterium]
MPPSYKPAPGDLREALFELSADGVLVSEGDGTIVRANPAACRALGASEEELVRGGRAAVVEDGPALRELLDERRSRGFATGVVHLKRSDGSLFPAEVASTLLGSEGGERYATLFHDLSPQRHAEASRHAREARFQDLLDELPTAVYVHRQERVELANRAALELFGAERPEQILGRSIFELLHPSVHEIVRSRIWMVRGGMRVPRVHERIVRLDGSEREVEASAAPVQDERGFAVQVVLEDVTDRLRAEEELRQAKQATESALGHLEATLEAIPDLLFEVDGAGTYLDVKSTRDALLAAPREELVGRRVREILPAEAARTIEAALLAAGQSGSDYGRVIELLLPGGRRWFELSVARKSTAGGEAPTFIVLSRDITERRKAEEALKRETRALLMLTRSNEALLRARSEEELFAEVCRILVETGGYLMCWVGMAEDDDRKSVRSVASAGEDRGYLEVADIRWADTVRGQGPTGQALRSGKPVVGRDFATDPNLAPWRDEALKRGYRSSTALPLVYEGKTLGVVTMYAPQVDSFDVSELASLSQLANDVAFGVHSLRQRTARLRAEHEREEVRAQLQQAQKLESIGRLAGGVAHDFNNLLTVILACGDNLREALARDEPPNPEYVEDIVAAGRRAAELTRQLLAFARKQVIVPEVVDLSEVVAAAHKLLRRVIGEDIRVEERYQPDLWPVRCDRGLINQMIINLAVNARDAMPRGGTLELTTANVELGPDGDLPAPDLSPGRYVRLTVRDSGHGMSGEVLEHLFEPFFTTKNSGLGTGLGLATVYGIVKQSGASIAVRSLPDQGTTFEIYFPRATGAAPSAPPLPEHHTAGHETVLVVEDEPKVREVAVRMLRAGGYRVLEAGGLAEASALARLEVGPLHLLITDIVMPGHGGPEVARHLRALKPEMRLLYTSGYSRDAISRRGVLEEGIAFLPKPFTAEELLSRVREVLDGG